MYKKGINKYINCAFCINKKKHKNTQRCQTYGKKSNSV